MNDLPLSLLFFILFILILLSAFFSSSETGILSINRYRLKHLASTGHKAARRVEKLLAKPDRLLGVVLVGNNIVNIVASAIATIIGLRLFGDIGIAIATGVLTIIILIFAEVTPKTFAAFKPEKIAFPASLILTPLQIIFHPVVVLVNSISGGLLSLIKVKQESESEKALSVEELKTVVQEAGNRIPQKHQKMLLNILDLEKTSVDDLMIPKNEVVGIDIYEDIKTICDQLSSCQHTRLPIYQDNFNNIIGIVHLRKILKLKDLTNFNKDDLMKIAKKPYFIPEGIPLNRQLLNFQRKRRRLAVIVDEYGDAQGIVTLEDILEEIVGQFTTDTAENINDIHPQKDGSYYIDGSTYLRELNKTLKWQLPTNGAKTLSGLVIDHLQSIPNANICIQIGDYLIETIHIKDKLIKTIKISKRQKKGIKQGQDIHSG